MRPCADGAVADGAVCRWGCVPMWPWPAGLCADVAVCRWRRVPMVPWLMELCTYGAFEGGIERGADRGRECLGSARMGLGRRIW